VAKLDYEELRKVAQLYVKHNGSCLKAAIEAGIPRTTFSSRVETCKREGLIHEEDEQTVESANLQVKRIILKPTYKIFQRPKYHNVNERVLAIGDCHDGPDIKDKTRFYAMGRYAALNEITKIVQIGDFTSMDSMSAHEPNWTISGQGKPSFKQDVESFRVALEAFDTGLGSSVVDKHVTLGNHEDRISRFVNNNPEVSELLFEKVYDALDMFGWTYSPYGEFFFIGDVGFTHVPLNQMGKPYGGMNSETTIARDSLHDVVYGHTHKRVDKTFPKMGHDHITIINLGCALPQDHIEHYARHSVTGWSYGVYDLTIQGGKIKERTWVPMETLMRKYADA
jgi:hypothetical protein